MSDVIASLKAVLGIDATAFNAGLNQAQSGLEGFANKAQGIGSRISGFGSALVGLTAPFVAFGVAGVGVAAKFEAAMTEIGARTGLTGDEMEKVRNLALQLGADTQHSAQQAAEGFLQLLASGQSAEEAIKTLPAVLTGAAASGADLGQTADDVTNIMATFGLEASDAEMIVNSLAQAAASSSADMSDLGQSFNAVGNVAKQFGLSVEETNAIFAIFAETGMKGERAGTQLRSMLTNMARPTDAVAAAWKKLGTTMFDTNGKMKPFRQLMIDIKAGMAGLSDEERVQTLNALAGSWGQMGIMALTSTISIDEMLASMNNAASATDIAAAKSGTFAFALESLRGSVETLMIEALTPFMNNVLTPLVKQITDIVNNISTWAKENPELTTQIIQVVGAVALLGGGLVLVGSVIGAVGAALAVLLSPLALIAAGVAFVAWAWTTNWMDIQTTVKKAIGIITYILWQASITASTVLNGISVIVGYVFGTVVPQFAAIATKTLIDFANNGIAAVESLANAIGGFLVDRIKTAMQIYGIFAGLVGDTATVQKVAEAINSMASTATAQFGRIEYPDWLKTQLGISGQSATPSLSSDTGGGSFFGNTSPSIAASPTTARSPINVFVDKIGEVVTPQMLSTVVFAIARGLAGK